MVYKRELEKQIAELTYRVEELQEQNSEMFNTIALQEQQIEKMKQCGNCGNRTIGNCEYCKRNPNQIFADTLTSDYWRLKEIKK